MRLSEAIRLGAMLHPQCFGALYEYRPGPADVTANEKLPRRVWRTRGVMKSCALGAALMAGYSETFENEYAPVIKRCCPACRAPDCLTQTISHLNDRHRWTREAIADWVQTIEEANDEKSVSRADGSRLSEGTDRREQTATR